MTEWQDISTAPKDGTVFIARDADHPDWGSWPMLRWVDWLVDDAGGYVMHDRGGWLHVLHNEPEGWQTEKQPPRVPLAIAPDVWNGSVRYEWMSLPAPPTGDTP